MTYHNSLNHNLIEMKEARAFEVEKESPADTSLVRLSAIGEVQFTNGRNAEYTIHISIPYERFMQAVMDAHFRSPGQAAIIKYPK